VHNYIHLGAQEPQRYLGKFTSYMTFDAHKPVRSQPFLGATRSIARNSYGNVSVCLGGWLVWVSLTVGIVSKRLNLS